MAYEVSNSTNVPASQAGAASDSAGSAAQTEFAKTLSQQAQNSGDQAPLSTNGGAELQNPDTGPYKKVGGDHVHQVASRTSAPGAKRETAPQFRDAESVSTKNPAYADKAGQKVEGAINRAAWGRDYNGKPAGSSGKVTLQATGNTAVGSSNSATPSTWFEDTKSYYKLREAGKTPDEAARLVTSSGEQLAEAGATPQRVPNAPRSAPANLKAGQTLSGETPTTLSTTAQKGVATEANAAELPKTAGLPQAAKADQAATTVSQGAKAEGAVSQAAKLEQVASEGAQVAKAESIAAKVLKPLAPIAPALKVIGKVAGPVGAALSAHALGEDIAKGDVAAAVSDGAGAVSGGLETFALASGALGAGEAATGAAALAAEAAPVVAAAGVGVAIGTYIDNHTEISDTAASAGMWVEKHTGGSMIAGATAAAATSIVTAPYYAGVAVADAGVGAVKYVKDWF